MLERANLWDTADDVAIEATYDVYRFLEGLVSDPDGILRPRVGSIELDATISPRRRSARIVGVLLPKGVTTGDDPVIVRYYPHGSGVLEEVEGTLTLPKGVSRSGALSVMPTSWDYREDDPLGDTFDGTPPQTLAELVDELNADPANSDLLVVFEPEDGDGSATVEALMATPCVFSNGF